MNLRTEKLLVSAVLLAVLGGGFFAVAAWIGDRSAAAPPWLATRLDARIPLVPSFVWIYLSWYPATGVVLLADRETFRRAYLAYVVAFAACAAGYILLPVVIPRPSVPVASGLSGDALALLYTFDPPRNLFPSFHAAIAAVLWRLRPPARVLSVTLFVWVITIFAACVLTKQHYVLDVVAGFVVGGFAVALVDVARRAVAQSPRPTLNTVRPVESETGH